MLNSKQKRSTSIIARDTERVRVESYFPQSYGTFEQQNMSKAIDFFSIWLMEQKKILFLIRPAQAGPAMTQFDGLFLNQFITYTLEIATQSGNSF